MQHWKRVHPRARVHLPTEFQLKGSTVWEEGVIQDLSAGGAAMRSARELPLQTELRLRLRLPDTTGAESEPLEIVALVVRIVESCSSDPVMSWVSGVLFLTLQGVQFERVRAFVWSHLPEEEA